MAIVASGKWTRQPSDSTSSVEVHDFFSGVVVPTATYDVTNTHDFGFGAGEIHIYNPGGSDIQFQFPRLYTQAKDSGIVKAGQSLIIKKTNHSGLKVRCDSGASTYYIMAW